MVDDQGRRWQMQKGEESLDDSDWTNTQFQLHIFFLNRNVSMSEARFRVLYEYGTEDVAPYPPIRWHAKERLLLIFVYMKMKWEREREMPSKKENGLGQALHSFGKSKE